MRRLHGQAALSSSSAERSTTPAAASAPCRSRRGRSIFTGAPSGRRSSTRTPRAGTGAGLVEDIVGWMPHVVWCAPRVDCVDYPARATPVRKALDVRGEHATRALALLPPQLAGPGRARSGPLDRGGRRLAAICCGRVVRRSRRDPRPHGARLAAGAPRRPRPLVAAREAHELAALSREQPWLAPVAIARAEAAWLEGRHDGRGVHRRAEHGARRSGVRASWRAGELAVLALAGRDRRRASRHQRPEPYRTRHARATTSRGGEAGTRTAARYEAALALAEADDDATCTLRSRELQALGAGQPPRSSRAGCAIAAPAGFRAGRAPRRAESRPA